MIQPPGRGGRPSIDHFWSAATNASWTASSAMSMSPKTRISEATACPDSSRKMPSISVTSSFPGDGLSRVFLAAVFIPEWTHLDGSPNNLGDL
jgi:hypothetical protein